MTKRSVTIYIPVYVLHIKIKKFTSSVISSLACERAEPRNILVAYYIRSHSKLVVELSLKSRSPEQLFSPTQME